MTAAHRPASHPVLRRMAVRDQLSEAMREPRGVLVSASEVADLSTRIEDLAQRVAWLPDGPLTGQQRRGMIVVANELLRRAQA